MDDVTPADAEPSVPVGEVSPAAVLAARAAVLYERVASSGAVPLPVLAALWGVPLDDAAARVDGDRGLFTVELPLELASLAGVDAGLESPVVVPQVLLTLSGGHSPVCAAVEVLCPVGLTGWELWAWLVSPSGWLSGDVPADVFWTNPVRALRAATAYAEELSVSM